MEIKWARTARRHRIGRDHARYVIETVAPEVIPATDRDEHWRWIGPDDRGIELEVEAVLTDVLLIIHFMPTAVRRNR